MTNLKSTIVIDHQDLPRIPGAVTSWVADPQPGLNLPEWVRTSLLDRHGTVFVPAAIGGSEAEVVLCAIHDGEPVMRHMGHAFVRTDWLRRERPSEAALLDLIESRVVEAAAEATAAPTISIAPTATSEATAP